ncbi:carotenoid biosynthesis protein [Desertivirga brevis]|uniref:carotenoid biosynthesis protein n=1 Tax=Desertivirga brevis TaxID=2810310 RepID=UPI001A956A87|nr:carotenoid biosynthesis protein [Pedobacter sp. SYSU D00873]
MKFSKARICGLIVVLFYTVGFFGLSSDMLVELFKDLVPFHLLLMFLLIMISHDNKNRAFYTFVVVTYIAGFLIELAGVKTGYIFGDYTYGATLGYKIADIPLIIGINWVLMVYSTGAILENLRIKSRVILALLGAGLLSIVDILIEPVAVKYDYWSWANAEIPFHNTVGWFFFSIFMMSVFYMLRFEKNNPVGSILFIIQALFFLALNITII